MSQVTNHEFPVPPEASEGLRSLGQRIRGPVDNFMHLQTAGGIVLLAAAAIALVWANVDHHGYHDFLSTPLTIGFGDYTFGPTAAKPHQGTIHFWINDGLMTLFFMVAGFEIKREIAHGELSDAKRAALPLATALGGMLVPALIYFSLNASGPQSAGWGVPMATDIAFAVGILSLLGDRVPSSLRILLLALAIIDDLGAILVIAIFYSGSIDMTGVAIAGGGLVALVVIRRAGVRPGPADFLALAPLWMGLHIAGVHATLAGVIVGLSTPARAWLTSDQFSRIARQSWEEYESLAKAGADEHEAVAPLQRLSLAGREAISPVVRGETQFHPWVAFVIMPLFAVANAGVYLGGVEFDIQGSTSIIMGVALGLALGKPVGVMLFGWLAVRLGIATLPKGVTWTGVLVVGFAAGIGFTMSIFIAELAFPDSIVELRELAKLAILIATATAGIAAMVLGRLLLPKSWGPEISNVTPTQAERSTDL